jgi:hypothetical protein
MFGVNVFNKKLIGFSDFDPTNKSGGLRRTTSRIGGNKTSLLGPVGLGLTATGVISDKKVSNLVDDVTGVTATRDAEDALSSAQEEARSFQEQALVQQRDLFQQQQTGTQSRLDQLLSASQTQFDQQQAGTQGRFDQQQQGIQDRFDSTREQLDPFLEAGRRSISSIEELMANPGSITNTPAFKFRLQQGVNAVQNSAAAGGSGLGGNTLRALQATGQGLASQELDNEFRRRATLFGGAQNSIGQLIQASGQQGQQTGQAFGQLGQGTNQAFSQRGQATLGGFGQAGSETASAFGNFSNNLQSGANSITNSINQQGQIQASSILGQRQNQVDTVLGIANIASLFRPGAS